MAERGILAQATPAGADPDAAGSTPEVAWPSAYSRHPASQDVPSMVDPADATAWSMPYTDLTMLLMVFFIVMLSIVGPDPSETSDHKQDSSATSQDISAFSESGFTDRDARSPIDGGDGILSDNPGILPDGGSAPVAPVRPEAKDPEKQVPMATTAVSQDAVRAPPLEADPPEETDAAPDDTDQATAADFAAAWAQRVGALEMTAVDFLVQTGLENTITLKRTETGIELRLPDHLLFSSGSAEVQGAGIELLHRMLPLLDEIDGSIQVSGHTDNVPIQTVRFPSNWELSAARAIAVVRLLRQMGIEEAKMQAVGHGANRPIASNSHSVGRAINRRVTIDISPRPGGA